MAADSTRQPRILLNLLWIIGIFTVLNIKLPPVSCEHDIPIYNQKGICPEAYFQCVNDTICIPQRDQCNGQADCPTGSDEENCDDKYDNDYYDHLYRKNIAAEHDDIDKTCYLSYSGVCICRARDLLCHHLNYEKAPKDLPQEFIDILDFTGNNFGVLSRESLEGVPDNVNKLSLVHCNIVEVKPRSFFYLRTIHYLHLDNNYLKNLPPDVFSPGNELMTLSLMHNVITTVHHEAFLNLKNLIELDLRGNRIEKIEPHTFEHLGSLTILYLQNNKIKYIGTETFPPLRIQQLSLTDNKINMVEPGAFASLQYLKSLYLSNNDLRELKNNTFKNLTNLKALTINDNFIETIEEGVFLDTPNLNSLRIERNQFRSLSKSVLSPLRKLNNMRKKLCVELVSFIVEKSLKPLLLDTFVLFTFHRLIMNESSIIRCQTQYAYEFRLIMNESSIIRCQTQYAYVFRLIMNESSIILCQTQYAYVFRLIMNGVFHYSLSNAICLCIQINHERSLPLFFVKRNMLMISKIPNMLLLSLVFRLIMNESSIIRCQTQYAYENEFSFSDDRVLAIAGYTFVMSDLFVYPIAKCQRRHKMNREVRRQKSVTSFSTRYFDRFEMCEAATHVRVCLPHGDGISSHEHLLDNIILRTCVWLMGAIGCAGNLIVLLGRLLAPANNKVHSLYLRNLATSDLLMGVYLFIIASVDLNYRGVYLRYQYVWRHSYLCNLCGFLSTLSCESSVLILTLVTWDRFVSVTQPLARKQPSPKCAALTLLGLWLVAGLAAVAPLSGFTRRYFGDEFYGNNGVCLPLHIHEPFAKGWEYSAVMFIVINSCALVFICYAYMRMINEIQASGVACRSTRQSQDREKVAQRFGVIVLNDCACWVPVIIVKLVALAGVHVPDKVYAWLAIFILPINSALNPVLYTLMTTVFKKQLRKLMNSCILQKKPEINHHSASESGLSLSIGFPLAGSQRRTLNNRATQSSVTASKNSLSWKRSTPV